MKRLLEVCCYSVESALKAAQFGADRIELCDNFSEGGTTPSYGGISYAIDHLEIPINVMVRPRGGDFLYSEADFEIMKNEVRQIKKTGAKGVVLGFLEANGDIDIDRTHQMVDLAFPLEVTFHRAFDMCREPEKGLEQLIEAGVSRLLSSGTRVNVYEGKELLAKLVEQAGDRIVVMPGCGLNPENVEEVLLDTGAREFHTASKTFLPSKMEYFNPHVSMGGVASVDEYQTISVDEAKIRAMLAILKTHS